MHRLAQASGKIAAAAIAAAASTLIASTAPAQNPLVPAPGKPAVIEIPDAPKAPARAKIVLKNARVAVPDPAAAKMAFAANPQQAARLTIEELRPIFRAELRVMTSAIEPTPSQRREIALEAGRTLKQYAESAAKNNPIAQGNRASASNNDPRRLVRNHLEIAAWPRISTKQSARYRSELDRKERARREVVVLNVVASVDNHLRLDAGQREKLCEALRSDWDDRDYPAVETTLAYDDYVPSIPDQLIVPILTDGQRRVWRGLRKVHLASVRLVNPPNTDLLAVVVDLDDEPEDEDVKAALGEVPR